MWKQRVVPGRMAAAYCTCTTLAKAALERIRQPFGAAPTLLAVHEYMHVVSFIMQARECVMPAGCHVWSCLEKSDYCFDTCV
jgi:hypothetical protein